MLLLLLSDDLDLPTNLLCVIFETNGAELSGKKCVRRLPPPRFTIYNLHHDKIRTSPLPLSNEREKIDEMHRLTERSLYNGKGINASSQWQRSR
jgi:hypothetical protein